MSHPMPTITIRLPKQLLDDIDQELLKESAKNPIAKPSRSDWVRHAVEVRLGDRKKAAGKKRRPAKRCFICNAKIGTDDTLHSWLDDDGVTRHACMPCGEKRLLK